MVWPLAIAVMDYRASTWMLITVYPGQVVAGLFPVTGSSWRITGLLPFAAVSVSYGLLALLVHAMYRRLRRKVDGTAPTR
jgi:hypothetical protein